MKKQVTDVDEAIRELKRTSFRDVFKEEIQKQEDFVQDCTIDTDLEILIPDSYVESITERLTLYTRLDNCDTEEELQAFHAEMLDRFGPIPHQVEDLFITVRCRRLGVAHSGGNGVNRVDACDRGRGRRSAPSCSEIGQPGGRSASTGRCQRVEAHAA